MVNILAQALPSLRRRMYLCFFLGGSKNRIYDRTYGIYHIPDHGQESIYQALNDIGSNVKQHLWQLGKPIQNSFNYIRKRKHNAWNRTYDAVN